jgi:hypothetical protein
LVTGATASGAAAGVPPSLGWLPEDGPPPAGEQHGGTGDHLPAGSKDVKLISKLKLTERPRGIADVGYFNGFAYLNASSPECVGNGGAGTGVHVVDIRDRANPRKVAFIPSHPNSFQGEGIHVVRADTPWFKGDMLIHNNETCNSTQFAPSGASLWDVTDPFNPRPLNLNFGDPAPATAAPQTYHTTHSAQLFTQPGKVYAVLRDNDELADVDIVDVSNPAAPVLVAEQGLENWPGAQGSYANGDTVNHHDMQFKRIGGHDFLAVSYWDAGQVLLNVDNPAAPVFVGDSDYRTPDPLMPHFEIPEGNSHQSYWSSDSRWLISTDEDFSPFRTNFEMTTGPNAGPYGAGEFGFTPSIDSQPDSMIGGPTVFGGRGCFAAGPNAGPDAAGDPMPPPAAAIPAAPGEEKTVVFSRGGCFFSTKIAAGQDLGYDAVIIGQSHGGTRNGLLPDAFFCGGQGHDYDEQIPSICIGHQAMHLMFNTTPVYTGPEGLDIPLGAMGEKYVATTEFDGWGYVQLHDATQPDLPITDSYAVPEALNESFADGFGTLSVHEVKTDPRRRVNLAYFSYYSAGFRVAEFGPRGIEEVGFFIDEGGNFFWGVFPIGDETAGHGYPSHPGRGEGLRPDVLASDRDFGLYIFQYTGKRPKGN